MLRILTIAFLAFGLTGQRTSVPCRTETGRLAERVQGTVKRGPYFAGGHLAAVEKPTILDKW
jgi:hypothetical protein